MLDLPLPSFLAPIVPAVINIAIAIAILVVGWIISRWGRSLTRRAFAAKKIDPALAGFVATLVQYALLAATVISALGAVGIQTTSLLAIFASAGLAVGLALQGSLASFASGVLILFFRPFDLGHKITGGGQTGVVQDIGLFTTTLLTADNEVIIIPNSAITSASIVNHTTKGTSRAKVDVTVPYGTDFAKLEQILLDSAKRADLVLKEPAPAVVFAGFGQRGADVEVYVWANAGEVPPMLNNVRRAIYKDLDAGGIAMPPAPLVAPPK